MNFLNQATNAVNVVRRTISAAGPAKGLSQVLDGITGTLSRFGSAFSGGSNVKLPLPNPLHAYASHTYSLGIGCLSDAEANAPDATYMRGGRIDLLCKSAGADPNNRVATPYGKSEFYVDNVQLNGQIGFQNGANSNIIDLSFTIIEPYSMGLLIIAMQILAQKKGYNNWRDATYVLTINFRGNTETGQILNIPNTFRCIPFIITDWVMNVDQEGAKYKFTAMASNMEAFSDANHTAKSDWTITGASVVQLLQQGKNSLQVALNRRAALLVRDKPGMIPDRYVITFPKDTATANSGSAGSSENKNSATVNTDTSVDSYSDVLKLAGVAYDEESNNYIQAYGDLNVLGQSIIDFDQTRSGDKPMAEPDKAYNNTDGTFTKGKITVDPEQYDFKFPQGSDISQAINEVLMKSKFITETLDPAALLPGGYRGWWRIDTKTYKLNTTANDAYSAQKPRIFVYRVTPYNVHSSNLIAPYVRPRGLEELRKQVVKEYNYIYTGKNVDILKFNFTFDNGYGAFLSGDTLDRSQDSILRAGQSQKNTTDQEEKQVTVGLGPGGTPPSDRNRPSTPAIVKFFKTLTGTGNRGGSGLDSEATRAARLWHDMVTRSDQNMQNIDMEILGDPYFIMSSGTGNYTSAPGIAPSVKADGSINFEDAEVHIAINFRTPIDINQATGLYNFKGVDQSVPLLAWSGLYRVTDVTTMFNSGEFKQLIHAGRMPYQEGEIEATPDQVWGRNETPVSSEQAEYTGDL
jgi:hypothetical protein